MVVALVVQAVLLAGLAFFGYRIYRNAELYIIVWHSPGIRSFLHR